MIKAILIDDNLQLQMSLKARAACDDIDIVAFSSWEDAASIFETQIDSWDAIILDAQCGMRRNQAKLMAESFLGPAITKIETLCEKHRLTIPWFVYSGGPSDGICRVDDLLENYNRPWSRQGDSRYYQKGKDTQRLLDDIKLHSGMSVRNKVVSTLYPDVFDIIGQTGLGSKFRQYMLDLLMPMHGDNISIADYNHRLYIVREVIEAVFSALLYCGDIPAQFSHPSKGPDISNCNAILTGEDYDGTVHISPHLQKRCPGYRRCRAFGKMPKILGSNLKNMIMTVGDRLHDESVKTKRGKLPYDTEKYFETISPSNNLVKSYALQLCDLIRWYGWYKRQP